MSEAAAAVRDAISAISTVLFLDTQRKEALRRKRANRELDDLVLTAERQFLWDALARLRRFDPADETVVITEFQAKHLERLDALRGSLGVGDAATAKLLTDLQAELRERTHVPALRDAS